MKLDLRVFALAPSSPLIGGGRRCRHRHACLLASLLLLAASPLSARAQLTGPDLKNDECSHCSHHFNVLFPLANQLGGAEFKTLDMSFQETDPNGGMQSAPSDFTLSCILHHHRVRYSRHSYENGDPFSCPDGSPPQNARIP